MARKLSPYATHRTIVVLAAAALAAGAAGVTGAPAPAAAGCMKAYSYAGVVGTHASSGVSARLSALAAPDLRWGHVAAWVGVGGAGAGPNGADEWLQVGLSGYDSSASNNLYFEYTRPGTPPTYTQIAANVAVGAPHTVSVLEVARRPGWWRVWVDGRAVSPALRLPGSHAAWQPMVVAESWNGGHAVCNTFAYRFDTLRTSFGGGWSPFTNATRVVDPGYRLVRRTPTSWLARSG